MNFKIFIPVTFYYVYRDDDNDKSDDDENERIDFSVNTQARDRIKIQNDFLAAEHGKKQNYFLRKTFIAFFSSPELKAQVSFSDHLSSVVCLSVCLSVRLSVNFSHFHLLLQNHWANFNQTWHKVSLGEGDSSLFK